MTCSAVRRFERHRTVCGSRSSCAATSSKDCARRLRTWTRRRTEGEASYRSLAVLRATVCLLSRTQRFSASWTRKRLRRLGSMAIDLPDINLWLALSVGDHAHHERAERYWYDESAEEIAFCRITALGFLRLCTNSSVMSGAP